MSTGFYRGLPESWSWTPLKFASIFLNRGTAPNYVDNGPIRAISQAANQAFGLNWERTRFHNFKGDPRKIKGYLLPNDVLVNSTGTGTLGRVGYFTTGPDKRPCIADGHVTVVRADLHVADPRFIYYWMSSAPFQDYIYSVLVVGATNQIELNRERLAGAPIALPPVEEQRRIADFLDAETSRIDQLFSLQTFILKKLDERDRAVRDNLINPLVSQIGELPLRRFIVKLEQGSSPSCINSPREIGKWGVLKLSAVKQGKFFPEENKQLPDEIEPLQQYEVRNGDLLVSRANTPELVGDVAVVEGSGRKLLLPDLIYRISLDQRVNPEFAAQVFLSSRVRTLIQATARGSSQTMVKLRGEDIRDWPIPLADRQQQKDLISAIDNQLDLSSALRNAVTNQLTLLSERRQALITAAVTGQLDVTTARTTPTNTGGVSV